jgi:muramoyltetrapeptide carboxypeptidase
MKKQTNIVKPVALRKGDEIRIVTLGAPDAALNGEMFDRGMSALKAEGFNVTLADNVFGNEGYMVCSPEKQAEDLNAAFYDKSVRGIFLAGGGFNANRVLPYIDYKAAARDPKVIVGMSNMSVVLNAITAKTGIVTFYGPAVIFNLGDEKGLDPYSSDSLWSNLKSAVAPGELVPFNKWTAIVNGKASGKIIAGNLSSLQSLIGTKYEPEWRNSIFFWEDCFAEIHNIDMILTHFKLSGAFRKLAGMVIGRPLEIEEKEFEGAPALESVIADIVGGYGFPIIYGADFGHNREKFTIPIGCAALIDTDDNSISISESGVTEERDDSDV